MDYILIYSIFSKLTTYEESNHLRFYIAMDNCIFVDEICKMFFNFLFFRKKILTLTWKDEAMKKCNKCIKCKQHPKGVCNKWSPLLLIIPLRLGLNEFNQDYKEAIKVNNLYQKSKNDFQKLPNLFLERNCWKTII